MIQIPKRKFVMGSDYHYPEERPAREVSVASFAIDACAVTNEQFAAFVDDTGHVTSAEQPPSEAQYPGFPPAFYTPAGAVFFMSSSPVSLRDANRWWKLVPGADWRHPEGPESDLCGREHHPVVQVSLLDARAFAAWAGKALPTESQWEAAAQAGFLEGAELNIWMGKFPYHNQRTNCAPFTVEAEANESDSIGLFNMLGNVWEWTENLFHVQPKKTSACCVMPGMKSEKPPKEYVLKGGSFLCNDAYCRRYRPAARIPYDACASSNHIGFRCVSIK